MRLFKNRALRFVAAGAVLAIGVPLVSTLAVAGAAAATTGQSAKVPAGQPAGVVIPLGTTTGCYPVLPPSTTTLYQLCFYISHTKHLTTGRWVTRMSWSTSYGPDWTGHVHIHGPGVSENGSNRTLSGVPNTIKTFSTFTIDKKLTVSEYCATLFRYNGGTTYTDIESQCLTVE